MRLLLSLSLFLLSMACDAKDRLPDSLLTLDKAYYYCIAKPETTLAIIKTMRQRQMAPEWQLDMADGDVNYGMRRYLKALSFYQKIDSCKAIKDSTRVQLLLYKWQMDCYDALLQDNGLAEAILRLRKKAQSCGDKAFEAMSYFMSGKWHHLHNKKDIGYRYCLDAVETLKASDYASKHQVLSNCYAELLIMYMRDGRYDEALRMSKLQEAEARQPWSMNIMNAADRGLRRVYALRACLLAKAGRMAEADKAYANWQKIPAPNVVDDEEIYDYLLLSHHHEEALNIIKAYREFIYSHGDSISMRMIAVLNREVLLHIDMGDTEKASEHGVQMGRIVDSLFIRRTGAQMQTTYKLLTEQDASHQKSKWLFMLFAVIIAFLLLLMLFLYYSRAIRQRNKMLLKTLNTLNAYRHAALHDELLTPEVVSVLEQVKAYSADADVTPEETEEPDDEDKQLFFEMDKQVTRDQLFLKPDFGRDDLMRLIGVDKNRFGKMIKKYSDVSNASVYVSVKRVEYGAKLLLEHPEYTISTIANECGMGNTVSFNRTFKAVFGITPSKYRIKMSQKPV